MSSGENTLKTVIIKDCRDWDDLPTAAQEKAADAYILDLSRVSVRDCLGCWFCWLKTPGRCVQKDLDDFYHAFFSADRAVFLVQESCGFVSGNLKTLLDRMIVTALPYIEYTSGEAMHVARYDKTPLIEIYYQDTFSSNEDRELFIDYFKRVCVQFQWKIKCIGMISEYKEGR